MFEGLVRQLIVGYLGRFVKDIQKDQLKITLWNEEVLLENVELILEAFDYLCLPFSFKQGRIGKLSIKIPWKKLGWDPIIINLEDLYVCISKRDDKEWSTDAVEGRDYARKKAKLAAAELAKLSKRVSDNQTGKSFISYITAKILDGIQVSIKNFHVLFHDTQCDKEEFVFGLKLSSLTVMRQSAVGSSSLPKLRGGQVKKLIKIQGLELYSSTLARTEDSCMLSYTDPREIGRGPKTENYSPILSPLNISVTLSVDRMGRLLNDAPQYIINADIPCLVTTIDEIQLLHIFSICDYLAICGMREKYGSYRPWWSPLDKKLNGWQKAWWCYAQESILSDVRKRLKKLLGSTSDKGCKNSRRKYVNLYKDKLKCLRSDEMIEEYLQQQLEELEKHTDIEEILHYRSIAEHELEDLMFNQSPRSETTEEKNKATVEDDRTTGRLRGWLNWLSNGVLGAGGTDEVSQFSGAVSDDMINDIYEATKFHPARDVIGDSVVDEVYLSSIKLNISEVRSIFRRNDLGLAICEINFEGISFESKSWDKTSIITASVNLSRLINPLNGQAAFILKKVFAKANVEEELQPSLSIKVDVSPPTLGFDYSMFAEFFCDLEMLKNVFDFLHVLQHVNFQQQRILLSLNAMNSHSSRLLSKIEYVLSSYQKTMWDIDIFNLVINLPMGVTDGEAANAKVEVRTIMAKTSFEVKSSSPYLIEWSHLLTRCVDSDSNSVGNVLSGFQLQDLYESIEIQINDAQVKLMRGSSTVHVVDNFCCAVNLLSCIIPDEPTLKGMELYLQAPSLVVHFSASIYRDIFCLISNFDGLIPPSGSSVSRDINPNILGTSFHPWISFSARFNDIKLLVNLEDSTAYDCMMVSLEVDKLGVWCDTRDFLDCWVSVQACHMAADDFQGYQEKHSLITGAPDSGSKPNVCIFIDHQNRYFVDETLIVNGCIVLHFESSNMSHFSQKCSVSVKELDIHCYPYVVGKFVGFVDKVVNYGVSGVSDLGHQISAGNDLEVEKPFHSNDNDSSSSKIEDPSSLSNIKNIVKDMRLQFSEMLPRGQKLWDSKIVNLSERWENHTIDPKDATRNCDKSNHFLADLDFVNVTVHFHDSSCIMWSVALPLAELVATISGDTLDVFCSTQGLVLSTSWWCQIVNEFLWGAISPNHSQVLNIQIRRRIISSQKSLLILSFDIQHVLCMLPPAFLALLIGYFSLPEWCPFEPNQPADCSGSSPEEPIIIKYCIEIAACDLIVPSNIDFSEFLKANINHLSVFISPNDGISVTQDIPFNCCIGARELPDKALCIDLLGCDVSISFFISEKEMVDPWNGCQNFVLIPSLCLDFWLRIPFDTGDNAASPSPTCLMADVEKGCVDIEVASAVSGLKALLYIIEQFSLVDKESQMFSCDVPDIVDLKERIVDYAELPETSNMTRTEMKFCVQSVFLRLLRKNNASSYCQLLDEAEMHLVLTVSLMDDKLHSLKISVFSLTIFSFINSVLLADFASPGLGLSAVDVVLSFSDSCGIKAVFSCSSANIWLHLTDWDEVICLLSSFPGQISKLNAGVLTEGECSNPDANNIGSPIDADSMPAANPFSLILEDMPLDIHFPALAKVDSSDLHMVFVGDQSCFISFNLRCRDSELIVDGKMVKLKIISENLNGILKLFDTDSLQTWPLFQLSKTYIDAEMLTDGIEKVSPNLWVRCDSLHFSLSNHMKYLFQLRWFHESKETPLEIGFKGLNIKLHLRKLSLLFTDRQWTSNGPLLEFLVRNTILCANLMEDVIEGSVILDLQVNYYSIDKVLWEPLLEPCKIQLTMKRKQYESSLLGGGLTDVHFESKAHLNLNINESIIEVVIRTIEMVKDAWISVETLDSDCSNNSKNGNSETRYAPYMLQNLTTLPLVFNVCQQQLGAVDLDVSPSTGILDVGSSSLIYINESPEKILFRYRPIQSCDKLNDMKFLEKAHRYVTFQLDGALRSPPISMDLSGRRYFEVEFLKPSHISEAQSDGGYAKRITKVEGDERLDDNGGFAVPVVIDVSVQRFTKLIRLYSTVVILNATSLLFEVRLDIPFGLSSKVLGPIYPGQEFPLPLHLAKVGFIRWRPVSDSYLWSEASSISSIISQDAKIRFFRSFVCYPSQPSKEAFRCCISVNDQCLPPLGKVKGPYTPSDIAGRQAQVSHGLNISLYQVVLTSPLVLKNYLMRSISVTFEVAGFVHTAHLSEVETSFHQVDSSSDLLMTFKMHGFKASSIKYPRAESFSEKAKSSGTNFSISEIVKFDPESSDGALYVTMDKVMDAVSGAREILISVPFLLYNCTGFSLLLSNSGNELKGHSCTMPSCYDLDEQKGVFDEKDGLGIICSDKSLYRTGSTVDVNLKESNESPSCHKSVTACLFSPDPSSYSGEVLVRLSRHMPSIAGSSSNHSWSSPFSLVPPTGSISIVLPQPTTESGYVLSVSSVAVPFSGRTKVITFQPRYIITNACTRTLCYKQKGTDFPFTLGAGCHSHVHWMDMNRELLLSIRFDEPGWEWSGSFLPEQLGDTQVKVRNYMNSAVLMMRVEVRSADVANAGQNIIEGTSGNSGIRLIILSIDNTGFMPYRISNHSIETLRIYQLKCESFETLVHPYTFSQYAWDEPCYPHRLIIEVPGERVLGSYAIDKTPAESLVHLPETAEKPERHLVVTIHSEGAIKVISVTDSSRHDVSDGKSFPSPQLRYSEKQVKRCEVSTYNERISLDIAFLGVSLMNAHPEELLFASAKNTKINFVQGLEQQLFSLQITSLQIDNQLHTTSYPVILSFNPVNKGNRVIQTKVKENSAKLFGNADLGFTDLGETVFSLAVSKWRNTDPSLVSFEAINLSMADVFLEIEQEIVLKLFEFGKKVSLRLESKSFQHMYSESTGRTLEKYPSSSTVLLGEDFATSSLLPNIVPIGAPWQQIQIDQTTHKKIYVEQFDVGPIKLTLSFSSSPWILRNGVLTSGESLIHRGLMALADVEGAKIHFRQFTLSHKIASWESIQEILGGHYSRQFLQEMYKVFGSAGVIGNPVGFARSLSLGISDFFSLPAWSDFQSPTGLITGMAYGTSSLLSNTIYAISDATSQFTKAAHKGIVAFTLDEQMSSMNETPQKGAPSHSKGVINEFLEGLTGVLQSPIQGAEKHGLPGVLSGIAVGVAGLMAKPAASILEVTGRTAQSIKNRSRIHQMGYRCFRIRLPRPLSSDSSLKPYSWEEAIGTYVLNESDMNLRNQVLVMCKALKQKGQYVLITGKLVLVVSCPSLVNLGEPDFEGVQVNLNCMIQSENEIDSIILAKDDSTGEAVHIIGNSSSSLPIFHTILEFPVREDTADFLRMLTSMIQRRKEHGLGSVHILHRGNQY